MRLITLPTARLPQQPALVIISSGSLQARVPCSVEQPEWPDKTESESSSRRLTYLAGVGGARLAARSMPAGGTVTVSSDCRRRAVPLGLVHQHFRHLHHAQAHDEPLPQYHAVYASAPSVQLNLARSSCNHDELYVLLVLISFFSFIFEMIFGDRLSQDLLDRFSRFCFTR